MRANTLIIDEFYNEPDEVRAFALSQDFDVFGNYPGARTKNFASDSAKELIANSIRGFAGEVTDWLDEGYTGAFQLTYSSDRTWIHSDPNNTWAGVLFLTPNAPVSGGTGIFQHKATQAVVDDNIDYGYDFYDYTTWEMIDRIGNKYNRLVLYRGDMFHAALDYFGTEPHNARLFQLFFFNTEY